jgi:hypothetical protein
VRVRLGDQWGAEGRGRSKRLAEREAARLTLIDRGEIAAEGAQPASEPDGISEPPGVAVDP